MNWYDITVKSRVEKFGVDKTERRFVLSSCTWTKDKLQAALAPVAESEGASGFEITNFALSSEAEFAAAPLPRSRHNIDDLLGI